MGRQFSKDITLVEDSFLEAATQPGSYSRSAYRASIEQLLNGILEQRLLSGAIVGILNQNERDLFTVGSGPATDSLIELGSVSKIFTGLLLAVMMERGLVHFDDPVHTYLPSVFAAKLGSRPIRIRDLAMHRSGLPSQASNIGRMKRHIQDPHYGCNVDDLLEELTHYDLHRPEPQQYSYSNLGYTLLGYALEIAGGAPFSVLMETLVLQPLGLKDTCIEISPERERSMPQGHTQAGRKAMRWRPSIFVPCGGICSTASDCMRLLEFFLHPSGPLKPGIEGMLHPELTLEEGRVLTWKQRPGEEWLWHNGVTGGFTAYLGMHPERKLGLVVLTNRYAITLATELGQHIQSILADEVPPPMSGKYEMKKAYVAQALIECVESPVWLRAGLAGLATGIFSWLLR